MTLEETRKKIKECSEAISDINKEIGGVIYPKIENFSERELKERLKAVFLKLANVEKTFMGIIYQEENGQDKKDEEGDKNTTASILALAILDSYERAVNWQRHLPNDETTNRRLGVIDTVESAYLERYIRSLIYTMFK